MSVVIQAGGESSRMGQDKALLPFLGKPMISRVMARLAPIAEEMLVTTNHPEDYSFLDIPLFSDLNPGHGALGGLYTALSVASHAQAATGVDANAFAANNFAAFEAPFDNFFDAYEQYQRDSAAWDQQYGATYGPSQPGYVAVQAARGGGL